MTVLVLQAFKVLAAAPSRGDIAMVARALRESADPEVLALFGTEREPIPDAPFDGDACDAVIAIALRAGARGFVGLDLYTEMVRPGWSPFPMPLKAES
jgi:hypothetical protein